MGLAAENENKVPCPYCDKNESHCGDLSEAGTNVENRDYLRSTILKEKYSGLSANMHPLSTGAKQYCAQAHHLICCESMDDEEWGIICSVFGYNINCIENGVILPADMRVACQLAIPLHKGNHGSTDTHIIGLNYVDAVIGLIDSIKKKAKRKGYCEKLEHKTIISDLNDKSKQIWENLKSFAWTLTSDGDDYVGGGIGCSGVINIGKKTGKACPDNRNHSFNISMGSIFLER